MVLWGLVGAGGANMVKYAISTLGSGPPHDWPKSVQNVIENACFRNGFGRAVRIAKLAWGWGRWAGQNYVNYGTLEAGLAKTPVCRVIGLHKKKIRIRVT